MTEIEKRGKTKKKKKLMEIAEIKKKGTNGIGKGQNERKK
jgi:hypothetical protein